MMIPFLPDDLMPVNFTDLDQVIKYHKEKVLRHETSISGKHECGCLYYHDEKNRFIWEPCKKHHPWGDPIF